MSKTLILIYGGVAYLTGIVGIGVIIAALVGVLPFGFLRSETEPAISSIIWNLLFVTLWGIIHSGMARQGFKSAATKIIPKPAERSTYILVAGVTSVALIALWHSVPGYVWRLDSPFLIYGLWALFAFGWLFQMAASYAINHYDLFGLRQVYYNFKNRPLPPLKFTKRAMYKYIRHPIQTGILIGIWATPTMSNNQIILSLGFTAYIAIGLWLEEHDLMAEHGEAYRDYKDQAGAILPKIRRAIR